MSQVTQLVGCKTEPWSWQAMPSTERGGESSVPPRTLPADQGLGLLGWRPSYIPGSPHGKGGGQVHLPTPKASFLSSCSCLLRMPASSPLSLQPSLEFQNAEEVQEGGWGGAKPAPPPSTLCLGAGATRNPVRKASC